jgi:hypothetical protein
MGDCAATRSLLTYDLIEDKRCFRTDLLGKSQALAKIVKYCHKASKQRAKSTRDKVRVGTGLHGGAHRNEKPGRKDQLSAGAKSERCVIVTRLFRPIVWRESMTRRAWRSRSIGSRVPVVAVIRKAVVFG